jgi:hypothetical protein
VTGPRLVAVYARRHEPSWLVDELRANLAWVDQIVEVDDRERPASEAWGHEGQLRARQWQAAAEAGADWVLMMDPDERLEDCAADTIRPLLEGPDGLGRVTLRELFRANAYRVDGRWGRIRRTRLFRLRPGQQMSDKPIHAPAVPIRTGMPTFEIDVNLYHLKMVEPENRQRRAVAYGRAEDQHGVRRRQWGALAQTHGMRLEQIPAGRGFTPGYTRPYRIPQLPSTSLGRPVRR